MKKWFSRIETKLSLVEIFLAVPLVALSLFLVVYWNYVAIRKEIDASRRYQLQTAADSFDKIYERTLKLLEKPYTDKPVYAILLKEYGPGDAIAQNADARLVAEQLLSNLLYYEPNISSVILVSEVSDALYYKHVSPVTSVNVHNNDWYNILQSSWYSEISAQVEPKISIVDKSEMFLSSGLVMTFSQRLRDVMHGRNIGAIRLELNISALYPNWSTFAENNGDNFLVLDHSGQLVFAGNEDFYTQYPLLSKPDIQEVAKGYHLNQYTAQKSGFRFVYLTDESVLLRQGFFANLLIGGVALVFFAYIALFIRFSTNWISKPVRILKGAMLQGQQKDLSARCSPLHGEMGELSSAFNALMEQIEDLVRDVSRKEQEKTILSHEMLQSKVNPHFLYNTLNAIRWKADILGAKEISRSLDSLSSLLRFSIKCADDLIPFSVELEQLENYLQIVRVRYEDEIDICFDIDEACFQYQCVRFLLQPIVENCYVHAFSGVKRANKIVEIRIACEADTIVITIEDNGKGMTDEQIENLLEQGMHSRRDQFTSIGLGNVHNRIQAILGDAYGIMIQSIPGRSTSVTATIPKIPVQECLPAEENQ